RSWTGIPGPRPERFQAPPPPPVPRQEEYNWPLGWGWGGCGAPAARPPPHEPIHQRDVEGAPLQRLARLVAAPAQGDVVPLRLEHAVAAFAQGALESCHSVQIGRAHV